MTIRHVAAALTVGFATAVAALGYVYHRVLAHAALALPADAHVAWERAALEGAKLQWGASAALLNLAALATVVTCVVALAAFPAPK